MSAVSDGNDAAALALCAPEFTTQTPRDKALTYYQALRTKLGAIGDAKLVTWNVREQAGTALPGTHVVLVFQTTHANGSARRTLTMYRRPGAQMYVLSDNVQSDVFLQ